MGLPSPKLGFKSRYPHYLAIVGRATPAPRKWCGLRGERIPPYAVVMFNGSIPGFQPGRAGSNPVYCTSYMRVYLLTLIRCRKSSRLHVGSIPTTRTLYLAFASRQTGSMLLCRGRSGHVVEAARSNKPGMRPVMGVDDKCNREDEGFVVLLKASRHVH